MNLEEAKIKSKITPEERKAVEDYIEFYHTQMNILASFDVKKYLELSDKGVLMLGAKSTNKKSQESSEKLGENILNKMEDFSRVFSAMCKYSKFANCPRYLYRGTTNRTARKLKTSSTYDRLISTTTDPNIAKKFTEYGNAGFLKIHVGDSMPFIDVDDFIGKENTNREENEFILAPFSKIKKAEYSHKNREYTYYDIELEAPELRPFKEGEKEGFSERIKMGFSNIIKIGKEYRSLLDEHELNNQRIKIATNSADIYFLFDKNQEIFNQIKEKSRLLDEFSEIMSNYIQGLCFEKQKEFEEASRIVAEDDKRRLEEENAKRLEEKRQESVSKYNNMVLDITQGLSYIPDNIDFNYNDLKMKEETFSKICSTIGISFNSNVDAQTIEPYISIIQNNINRIKENASLNSIPEDSSIDFVNSSMKSLEELSHFQEQVNSILNGLGNSVQMYNEQAIFDIKKGIDQKIQNLIRSAKIELLQNQRKNVENRKISFFGKIMGKEKLKELELQNLDLQLDFEKTKPIIEKTKYSIHDSLADMLVFSQENMNGQMTSEMQELYYNVTMHFNVDKNNLYRSVDEKMQAKPLVLEKSRISISEQISKLSSDNIFLKQGIQENIYNNSKSGLEKYNMSTNVGNNKFVETLAHLANITEAFENPKSRATKGIENETPPENLDDPLK